MKNSLFKIFVLAISIQVSSAQTTPKDTSWNHWGGILINLNQSTFYQWAPGGQSNIAFNTAFNYTTKYEKGKALWRTDFLGSYGTVRNFNVTAVTSSQPGLADNFWRKSDDVFQINSKYSRKSSEKWFYSANVNFLSQFDKGYASPDFSPENYKSNIFAPAFITAALGFTYKPNKSLEAFISPATGKLTVVNDQMLADLGVGGVKKAYTDASGNMIQGEKTRFEFGASAVIQYNKPNIIKNVDVKTMLQLFNNYTDEMKDNRKNIDVTWNWNIIMKVNKYLAASIIGQLVYDDNIPVPKTVNVSSNSKTGLLDYQYTYGKGIQLKNVLGIGFSYKIK